MSLWRHLFSCAIALYAAGLLLQGCVTATFDDFDNTATLGNADKYMAFVGERVRVINFDPAEDEPELEEGDDTIFIYFDLAYKARYRILELVHGDYDRETVDFKAYDHHGYPGFAKHDVVMLYLRESDGALYHVKYQFDAVHPTADGRYAACDDPYVQLDEFAQLDEIDRRPLHDIKFTPPVVYWISDQFIKPEDYDYYTEEEIAKDRADVRAYYSEPNFKVRGDYAICKKGVYPDELFRIMNETLLLPRRREELCRESLGINHFPLSDSEEGRAIEACIDEMKEKNLP